MRACEKRRDKYRRRQVLGQNNGFEAWFSERGFAWNYRSGQEGSRVLEDIRQEQNFHRREQDNKNRRRRDFSGFEMRGYVLA